MILEYLFLERTEEESLYEIHEEYKSKGVSITIEDFGNDGAFIVQYEVQSNNEKDAILLTTLNNRIFLTHNPITLTNEASAHFNKRLYPLFNEFERKLRKFVYLSSTYKKVDEAEEIVKSIENLDFGKIYDKLFTDDDFVKDVIKRVNSAGKQNKFSKDEILNDINSYKEITLWQKLIGEEKESYISENFLDIKSFRNDIMHSHNISYNDYKLAVNMISKANKELDSEIGNFFGNENEIQINFEELSRIVSNALKAVTKPQDQTEAEIIVERVLKALSNENDG